MPLIITIILSFTAGFIVFFVTLNDTYYFWCRNFLRRLYVVVFRRVKKDSLPHEVIPDFLDFQIDDLFLIPVSYHNGQIHYSHDKCYQGCDGQGRIVISTLYREPIEYHVLTAQKYLALGIENHCLKNRKKVQKIEENKKEADIIRQSIATSPYNQHLDFLRKEKHHQH